MRKILLLLSLVFCFHETYAQYTITGTVKDTVNLLSAQNASLSLIRSSDSILIDYTRADENGHFTLHADSAGSYFLLAAHPLFAQFIDEIDIKQPRTELPLIALISKKQILQEVVIRDERPIVIKGDTIEFNADSFKTRQYDNVDELLKKLPGLEVSRDGKITAYGKEVKKMLVDGEEFFSDDPAVVAKTLRASSVEKVQVFDKKSEQAEFTGIDDGEKIKTINLKLKDNAKRGYFGKVSAGGGLPGYWQNQAMINSFNKKRKMSAYGTMSNTSTNGLGWSDMNKYGGGSSVTFSNGSYSMPNGSFSGQGVPKNWNGGLHYNNKWWGDTLSFNGSYRYNKSIVEAFNRSRTQYILPDTQYINAVQGNKVSINQNHNISTVTEYKVDSLSSLRLSVGGAYGKGSSSIHMQSQSTSLSGGLINDNKQMQQSNTEQQSMNADLFYRKRFRKKGRSFSADFIGSWSENNSSGVLRSRYNLYAIDSAYDIDQRKENNNKTASLSGKFTYSEPLSEVAFLIFNYSLSVNNNRAVNNSYDRHPGNETGSFNPFYSSDYIFNSLENQGGANLRFNFKKTNLSFGGNVAHTRFEQTDKMYDSSFTYSRLNFFPSASFSFRRSQFSHFNVYYYGDTRQPAMEQLQPLHNNTDPLNVAIGNPDLKQEFNHHFSLSFYNFKALSGENIMIFTNFSFTQNAISQKQTIDISGRRTYQYVNVNGNFNASVHGSYGFKKILGLNPDAGFDATYARIHGFINGEPNINNDFQLTPNASVSYYKDTTVSFRYSFNPAFHSNQSSVRTDVKSDYWSFGQSMDATVYLPFHFSLSTSIDWNIRQKLDPQDKDNNVFFWNAGLSRHFLKDHSLEAKLFVHDILNQNTGYDRYNSPNQISEITYNTIQRYFMLSITWNFTKSGAAEPAGGIMVSP